MEKNALFWAEPKTALRDFGLICVFFGAVSFVTAVIGDNIHIAGGLMVFGFALYYAGILKVKEEKRHGKK